MKRTISMLMTVVFVAAFIVTVPFGMAVGAHAHCSYDEANEQCDIEAFSDDDVVLLNDIELDPSVRFLYDYNIPMTAAISSDEYVADYVLSVVESVCGNQDYYEAYGYEGNQLFFDRVASATREHFNLSDEIVALRRDANKAGLVDSDATGQWNTSYAAYNCYAYAIGKTDDFYRPGFRRCRSANYSYLLGEGKVDTIAALAVNDLTDMGYKCVYYTSTKPNETVLNSASRVICVRITSRAAQHKDFHFMKYDKNSSKWLHKPGSSAILRYKYSPDSKVWTNEGLFYNGYLAGTVDYKSEIYYIVIYGNHGATKYTYTVPSMNHSTVCKRCDLTLSKDSHILNSSQTKCKICNCPVNCFGQESLIILPETNKRLNTKREDEYYD